jgi:predicted transcriptional regulator
MLLFGLSFDVVERHFMSIESSASSPAAPELSLEAVIMAIGDRTRWKILAELSSGEPRMVTEIAKRLGRSPSIISKHMAALQYAGMAVTGRGRLWQVPAQFIVPGAKRELDFGHCRLRLPEPPA